MSVPRLGGLASGLDVDSVIYQLMAVERRPVTLLGRQKDTYQARLDAWKDIRGKLDSLLNKVRNLKLESSFTARSVTVGDPDLFTATADSTAAVGEYEVEVVQLAARKLYQLTPSSAVSDPNAALGAGELQVTARDGSGASVTRTITLDGVKSLQDVAGEINGWADTELKATVAQIRTGEYELVIEETRTGTAYDFTVTQTAGTVFGSVTVQQGARDALVKVDGIQYERAGNTVSDILAGVTLTLQQAGGPTSLSVARDTEQAYSAIKAFVDAYNGVADAVARHGGYDAKLKARGPLLGDIALASMSARIRDAISGVAGGVAGEANSLAMIGITTESKTGRLTIDETRLKERLADFGSDIQTLFQDATAGIAVRTEGVITSYTGTSGLIASSQEILQQTVDRITSRVRFYEDVILPKKEERLRRQFTRMEQLLAQFQSQGSWLQSQLAGMG